MGYAIAETIADLGAKVILISGPTSLSINHPSITLINVTSAQEMFDASVKHFPECDGAVMSAAVADFTPVVTETRKVKRGKKNYFIELTPTQDIAAELGQQKQNHQLLVGFALETNDEGANARKKLVKKNLDFIVLNSLNDPGAGFQHDTNKITIIDQQNKTQHFELKSKKDVAIDIVNKIIEELEKIP